jgi:hypothetical protein
MKKTLLLAFALLCTTATTALADTSYSCEVVEIDAQQASSKSIDTSLKDVEKYLTKGPLAIYNHFVKLVRTAKTLEVLKTGTYEMQKGTVTLMIREVKTPQGKKAVTALDISIDDEHGKRWLDAKQNVTLGKYGSYIRSVSDTEGIVYLVGCK